MQVGLAPLFSPIEVTTEAINKSTNFSPKSEIFVAFCRRSSRDLIDVLEVT
jgi:hypothetical protein